MAKKTKPAVTPAASSTHAEKPKRGRPRKAALAKAAASSTEAPLEMKVGPVATPETYGSNSSKAAGRGKYNPSACSTIIDLGKRGRSRTQMAAALGISRRTFDRWTQDHPEFAEAFELADTLSEAFWEEIGQTGPSKGHLFTTAPGPASSLHAGPSGGVRRKRSPASAARRFRS